MTIMRVALCVSLLLLTCGCQKKAGGKPPAKLVSAVDLSAPTDAGRLLRGIHPGKGEWRWTQPTFAVALDPPIAPGSAIVFELEHSVPVELRPQAQPVTVRVRVNGAEICHETYSTDGRKRLSCRVPDKALSKRPVELEVASDRSYHDGATGQERALIVLSMRLVELEATEDYERANSGKARAAMDRVEQLWPKAPKGAIREMTKVVFRDDVYMNTRFFDVPLSKIPADLWMMQQIIHETRPDFIVETGTWRGGSALYFAWLMQSMGLRGRVITVDIVNAHRAAASNPLWKQYVDFYLGSSTDPAIVKAIAERVKGRRVFVSLDSDHSLPHVLRELRMYGPMVHPGGYMVAEDTHLDGIPTLGDLRSGPTAALERFLENNKDFEIDYSREVAPSFNHGAWLKRK